MPATPLPNALTRANTDAAADDVAQARAELDAGLAALNTFIDWATWLFGTNGEKATAISNLGISTAPIISAQTGSGFSAGTVDNTLYVISPSGSSCAVTLPALSSVADGFRVTFKNNSDGKSVLVNRAGSDTIDGATSIRVPGRAIVELTRASSSAWIVTRKPEHMVGEVLEWRSNTLPDGGYAWLNGQALSRTTYAGLFAIWGTDFGTGDGSTTFNVPNDQGYTKAGRETMGGAAAAGILQKSTTVNTTNGSPTAVVASATDLCIGMYAFSANIPNGTTITAISGTTITLSANATATASGTDVRFSLINDPQGITGTGGAQSVTQASTEVGQHLHGAGTLVAASGGAHAHNIRLANSGAAEGADGLNANHVTDGNTPRTGTNDAVAVADHGHTLSGSVANNNAPNPMRNMQPTRTVNWIVKC